MNYRTVTIISEIDNDLQAWTLEIEEQDLISLMQKYDGKGISICGDADDITDEIKEIYK